MKKGKTLKIQRFDPEKERRPYWASYQVEVEDTDRLLDALHKVKWEQDGSLTFRRSCGHGVCGSDAMNERVIAQEGLASPSLIIADRWGEIWAAWLGGTTHQFPSEQDILQWLVFIEAQCPECTMIEWTDQEDRQ